MMSIEIYIAGAILLALIAFNLILTILLFSKNKKLQEQQKKLNQLFSGESVEELLFKNLSQQEDIAGEIVEIKRDIISLKEKQKRNFDRIGIVRYPASAENEAKLSYSVGITNESEDGLVITGLHFRQGVNIYFKHVKEGIPDFDLSEEEKKVIQRNKINHIVE